METEPGPDLAPSVVPRHSHRQSVHPKPPSPPPRTPGGDKENIFDRIGGKLLRGAASRLQRGEITCLDCRGSGTCPCAACAGTGKAGGGTKIKSTDEAAATPSGRVTRYAAEDGGDPTFRATNRCGRCRGTGRALCRSCAGKGRYLPAVDAGGGGGEGGENPGGGGGQGGGPL